MTAIDTVRDWFASEDWHLDLDVADGIGAFGFHGDHGRFLGVVHVYAEENLIVVFTVCPVRAPEGRTLAMVEAVARANDGLRVGNFEFDFTSGDVRFKTSLDFEGAELTTALAQQLVVGNVLTMDRYVPAFDAVARGVDAASAVAAIDGAAPADA